VAFTANAITSNSFSIDNLYLHGAATASSVSSYSADITSTTDYYAFGQSMPGRTWVGGDKYRYDFNGKESDKEVSSGWQNYGARTYDTRIARWTSRDPKYWKYPFISPYAAFANNPNVFIDPGGETLKVYGSIAAMNKFKAMITNKLGNKVTAKYSEFENLLIVGKIPGTEPFTPSEQALFDEVMAQTATPTNIGVVTGNDQFPVRNAFGDG
jgi:RHS repeat-associated protein